MSPIFQSGAFLQQCFAVHPLCLSIKRAGTQQLILSCSSCNLAHRLTLRSVVQAGYLAVADAPAAGEPAEPPTPAETLVRCASAHPAAVRVSAMDVVAETAGLRCAECRRLYDLDVASFETQQK